MQIQREIVGTGSFFIAGVAGLVEEGGSRPVLLRVVLGGSDGAANVVSALFALASDNVPGLRALGVATPVVEEVASRQNIAREFVTFLLPGLLRSRSL